MLTVQQEKDINAIMKKQGRLAYDVAKILSAVSNRKVSYTIIHKAVIDGNNIKIITTIEEYPHIQVGHGLQDIETEFLDTVDIDNIEV